MNRSLGIAIILAFGLTACGGGGGGSSAGGAVVPNPGSGSPQASQAKVTIIRAPATVSSNARSVKFIPATAQSIRVHVLSVNGATPDSFFADVIIALSTLNPACTTLSNGGLSCSVTVKVPQSPGVILQISAYNSTDGTGTPVAIVTTPPVDTTQPNPVFTASLGGVPAHLLVSSAVLTAPADGATHPLIFNVWATDASNNLIIPPGNYPTAITPSISGDTNTALTLQTTSVAGPGNTAGQSPVNIMYDSTKALTSATVTLTSGALTASVQINPLIFSPSSLPNLFAGGAVGSISVSEFGNASAFTVIAGSNATVACVPANCTPATTGGAVAVTLTPVSSGNSAVQITDGYHTTANATYSITGPTGGGITVSNYKIYEYTPAAPAGVHPYDITAGPDGKNVWFTDTSNSVIAALDTSTCAITGTPTCTIKETSATTGVWGILAGKDGNVYVSTPPFLNVANPGGFTQVMSSMPGCPASSCSTNFIGTYTATARPGEMARVADGSIYALDTLSGAGNILGLGTMPTPPIYDQFLSGSPTANYGFIAGSTLPGPTGLFSGVNTTMAWTDNTTSHLVMRYLSCSDCSNVAEEFAGFTGALGGLAFAADGTLYVIDSGGSTIESLGPGNCTVTVTPTCTGLTPHAIPSAGSAGAYKIVQGPDGNMWFTENGAGKIGILMPSTGKIYEIPVPSGSGAGPRGITVGPDGNIWFTEYNNGKIGEVVL
jgi:streptogramin lyase